MKKGKVTVDAIVTAIRKAVDAVPGIHDVPESSYVELYRTALEVIDEGLKMREEELGEPE